MKVTRLDGITLIGAVRGPVSEVAPVLGELGRGAPVKVILDIAPEELQGLKEHFTSPASEPLVPLMGSEAALANALSKFGEVRMPSPVFVEAVRWARENGAELLAMDVGDDSYTDLFLKNVGYLDLIRRTRAERALVKGDIPDAETAEELAVLWSKRLHQGKGSLKLWEERTVLAVERIDEVAPAGTRPPVVGIIDIERWRDVSDGLKLTRETSPKP